MSTNLKIDRTRMPAPQELRPFNFPDFRRYRLKNGLQLLIAEQHSFPLINVMLSVHSSALMDPPQKEGVAGLTAALLVEGTQGRSSRQIAEELELLGANFNSHSDWNALYLELNTLKRYFSAAMDVFADMVMHSVFPEKELDRLLKETLVERLRVVDAPNKLASERFSGLLYADSRYGQPIEGTEESLQKIERGDVLDFYQRHVIPGNSTLIVVGDVNADEVIDFMETVFSEWEPKEPLPAEELVFRQPEKTVVALVHKPGAAQTELRMGHLGIARNNPDYYAVTVMNEILGGYFLSRINMNLREEHGYTYGAHSLFFYRKGLGPFFVTAAVHSQNAADAIREVLKEIERMRQEAVAEEELESAKGQLIGVFPIAFETADQVALGLSNIVISQLPDDYYRTFRDRIAAVTREDVLRVAREYLLPEKMLIVAAADRSVVEDDLKKAFELRVLDARGQVIS